MSSVLDLLIEMKDKSELALDLAYAALLLEDKELARTVERIEEKLNSTRDEIGKLCLQSRPSPQEAESLVSVVNMANITERISDAAMDIARMVLRDHKKHPVLEEALLREGMTVFRHRVRSGAGKTLGALELYKITGTHVLGLKRGDEWHAWPASLEMTLRQGDELLVMTTIAGRKQVEKTA
ncbi:hypothetical protein HYS54_00550 [Candidatus Micrarchaeota archaeon]|nr:hypothetical protein [Candidatus Micrarchaeota archaeon]